MRVIFNKIIPIIIVLIGWALFFNSCEEEPPTLSVAKALTNLAVQDISSNSLTATINDTTVSFTGEAAAGTTSVTIQNIVVSDKATANKAIGDALPVNNATVTVTAEDGTTQNYTFSINVATAPVLSSDKAITAITINDGTSDFQGVISGTNITFGQVGFGVTEVTLTAIALSPEASANKSANAIINVNNSTIVVTAADGSTQTYTLTIVSKTLATLTNLMATDIESDYITVSTSYAAGNNATSEYGFVYSSVISGNGLVVGDGVSANTLSGTPTGNSFNATLQNLTNRTSYYVRAYAINNAGTAYSNQINPTTVMPIPPVLGGLSSSRITPSAATFSVPITTPGTVRIIEYGVVYSTTLTGTTLTITGNKIVGTVENPTGSLTVQGNSFDADTQYYSRAYATTSLGVVYSTNYINFRTKAFSYATLSNFTVDNINTPPATLFVSVEYEAGNTPTTEYGFIYSPSAPGDRLILEDVNTFGFLFKKHFEGALSGNRFTATLENLPFGDLNGEDFTFVRAYAVNRAGTIYTNPKGGEVQGTIFATLTGVSFTNPNTDSFNVTLNNYTKGNIPTSGYGFVYSNVISDADDLTIGNSGVSVKSLPGMPTGNEFSQDITGLLSGTTYFVRAYAFNVVTTGENMRLNTIYSDIENITTYQLLNIVEVNSNSSGSPTITVDMTAVYEGVPAPSDVGFLYSPTAMMDSGVQTIAATLSGQTFYASTSINELTTYYVRAYATNSIGTSYSNPQLLYRPPPPTILSISANSINVNSFMLTARFENETNQNPTNTGFLYSQTLTGDNLVMGASGVQTIAATLSGQTFYANITGLSRLTTYYVRAYAMNAIGDPGYSTSTSITPSIPTWQRVTAAAPWGIRTDYGLYSYSGQLWVMGGLNRNGSLNDIWTSADGENWTKVNPIGASWSKRFRFGAVVHNEELWVVEGERVIIGRSVSKSSDGANWSDVSTLFPNYTERFGAVSFDGYLYVIGGLNANSLNTVYRTLTGGSWEMVTQTSSFTAKHEHQAVVFQNKIWIMGGNNNGVWSSPDGSNWTSHGNAPWPGRINFAAAVYDNKIWIMGGIGETRNELRFNDVWYTSNGVDWNQLPSGDSHWSPRSNFSATVLDGQLYIMGGSFSNTSFLNDIWRFDLR